MNTSLILNKSNSEKRLSADDNRLSLNREPNSMKSLNDDSNCNEMQSFDTMMSSQPLKDCNLTPRSYSEGSSLDAKSSRSHDCLTTRSTKKRVNIKTDFLLQRNQRTSPGSTNNYDDLESGETSILNAEMDKNSLDRFNTIKTTDSYLTMTGTVKRGRKKGQSVDLQLNISRDELEKINAAVVAVEQIQQDTSNCCSCSPTTGMHILIFSLICLPFVAVYTSVYSFYIGTLTWYNIFNYFNEEKSYIHKLLMSPILILTYPVGICLCTIGLGIYAGIIQLSLSLTRWYNEITDLEKGFYGWLCSFLHLSDCSPYEVVILTDLRLPETGMPANSSTEELSL